MLRKSIAALSSAGKKTTPRTRKSVVSVKSFGKSHSQSNAVGRESVKITISPERIQNMVGYVQFLCPVENDLINLTLIQTLLLNPKPAHEKYDQQFATALQTTSRLLQLLQTTQTDHLDWFHFVLIRKNKSSSSSENAINLQEFCSEITRLTTDLRQPSFDNQHLIALFTCITNNANISEESNTLTQAQFEEYVSSFFIHEQEIRCFNAVAAELVPVSVYLKKNNVALREILEITGTEITDQQEIQVTQLSFLLSSLILMFEMYCKEFGTPFLDDIEEGKGEDFTPPPDSIEGPFPNHHQNSMSAGMGNPNNILSLQANPSLRHLTSNRASGISDITNPGDRASSVRFDPSILKDSSNNKNNNNSSSESGNTSSLNTMKKQNSFGGSLTRMISMKSFKIPTASEVSSSMGIVLSNIRKSFARKKSSLVVPDNNYNNNKSLDSLDASANEIYRNKSIGTSNSSREGAAAAGGGGPSSNRNNKSVEINRDFVKYLDVDERMKVAVLVKYLQEGDPNYDPNASEKEGGEAGAPSKSFFARYSLANRSSHSGKSHKIDTNPISTGFSHKENYIVISTDECDEHPEYLAIPFSKTPTHADSPRSELNSISIGGNRRRSMNNTNRIEGMRNSIMESFNGRIGRASILMAKAR
jgi:hypothetical protein